MSNLQIYHVSKNLFDYKTVYSNYIDSDGNVNTTVNNIVQWNKFSENEVGKIITISFYVNSISASYISVQVQIEGIYTTGNAINAGSAGYTEITVTPTSTSDRWRITYGTGTPDVILNKFMINDGNTRLPYEPYSIDVWHDLQPKKYTNGAWTDSADNPKKCSNGSWS